MSENTANNHKGQNDSMKNLSPVVITLVAMIGSAVVLYAAESETFTGSAAVSGTYKRPQLLVDDKRHEHKASDKAHASVAESPTMVARPAHVSSSGVTVIAAFPANKGPGWKDSIDVAGAVGPQHVVDLDVAGFVVHEKTSGEIIEQRSTREFWQRVEPVGTLVPQENANDARMLYDSLSERWFACAAGTSEPDCFLAVSTSSDPTERWQGVKLPLPRINPYMKMGVDRNGLYVCSCNGNADMNKGTDCYVIPKADVLAVDGPVLTRAQTFTHLQFSTMPAMDPDPDKPADAPAILLANEFVQGTCSELYLYRITWSEAIASIADVQTIPLNRNYLTPDNSTPQMEAFQPRPGPKLRAGGGGRRIDSAFVRNGSVFGCNGAKRTPDSRPGILWYEVRISDGALIQEGFVDSPVRDFIFPSVAVDSGGNVGIGCTGTSQTEFPSVYVMMHAANDPANAMRQPVPALSGSTSYRYAGATAVNLSHYSTTCVDPSNPGLLWTCQAYSNSTVDRQWCTAWAAFRLPEEEQSTSDETPTIMTRSNGQSLKSGPSAENGVFRGTAARSGTYKRPLLLIDGKRYELKASDDADAAVAEALDKFSKEDTTRYTVVGTRGIVNGNDGIFVKSIASAAETTSTKTSKAAAVTSKVVTVGNRNYTVYEFTDPDSKTYCVVIPEGLKTVRGLLVNSNYYAGDSRGDWTFCHYYREFMHLHDFALAVAAGTCPHASAFKGFRKSLQAISADSGHPELIHAPYVAVGFSAGGGFASTLMTYDPEKTIAIGIYGARYNFDVFTRPGGPAGPFAVHLAIPSVLITGEMEKLNERDVDGRYKVNEVFVPHRPKGAQLAWLERQGIGHEYDENRQDLLALPLLDVAVRTRYPKDGDVTKGPVKLLSVDPSTGWVADNSTWRSGLTKIVPATQFTGDLGHSSWLQNEDIAFIYRAYATYDNPLAITSPGPCGPGTPALDPGANVPIVVDDIRFAHWKEMVFFDGAQKLAEITRRPPQFTARNLTPGYHVFSVLAKDTKGTVRCSNPVMVVVRK